MRHGTSPFAELTRLQNELNRIFTALLDSGERASGVFGRWDPPMDVVDAESAVRVYIELPGVPPDTIEVVARGNTITISGAKVPAPPETPERRFHCLERTFGTFTKVISISQPINSHRGEASLHHGVLLLEFPKVPDLRAREVRIPVTKRTPEPSKCLEGRTHSRKSESREKK
jgi:HSP20 family protein